MRATPPSAARTPRSSWPVVARESSRRHARAVPRLGRQRPAARAGDVEPPRRPPPRRHVLAAAGSRPTSPSSTTPTSRRISSARCSASPGCWRSTSPPSACGSSPAPPDFEAMKERSRDLVPNPAIWRDADAFFHQGGSGQWRAVLTDDDLAHYDARVRELAPPELAAWVHHGRCEGVARDAIRDVRRRGDRRRRGRAAPSARARGGAHRARCALRRHPRRRACASRRPRRRSRSRSTSSTRPTGSTSAPTTSWCSAMKSQDTGRALTALAAVAPVVDRRWSACRTASPTSVPRCAASTTVYGVCVVCPALHLEPGVGGGATRRRITGILDIGRFPHGTDAHGGSDRGRARRVDVRVGRRAPTSCGGSTASSSTTSATRSTRCAVPTERVGTLQRPAARTKAMACSPRRGSTARRPEEDAARRGDGLPVGRAPPRSRGPARRRGRAWRGDGSIEADYLNGEIVLLGRLHGVPTPVNAAAAGSWQARPPVRDRCPGRCRPTK